MIKLAAAASIVCISLVGTTSAQSMPLVPLDTAETAAITWIADGCGRNWHRGRDGRCRRSHVRHVCPRGYRSTQQGCRPKSFF